MKRILTFCLSVLMLLGAVLPVGAQSAVPTASVTPTAVDVCAEAVVLADLTHDAIVYEKNADQQMHPASLTKIMTAVVVLERCADIDNTWVTVTNDAIEPLIGTDSSIFYLADGEVMSVKDLLAVLMIASANDAANALAFHFGDGSIDAFIGLMNEKATQLGMTGTHYVNAHGLDDDAHYTTARDMYILTKYAMQNETFKAIVSSAEYTVSGTNIRYDTPIETTVHLQNPVSQYYYEYAKGVKTGYTTPAGRCLITTAEKDGTTYLCVLLKCPVFDDEGYMVRREFELSESLYEWAFNTLEYRTLVTADTIVSTCAVDLGEGAESVDAVLAAPVQAIVECSTAAEAITVDVTLNAATVTAPVTQGQTLGTATVSVNGEVLQTAEVIAATSIALSEEKVAKRQREEFFAQPLVKAVLWIIGILLVLFVLMVIYLVWRAHKRRIARRRRQQRMQRL